MKYYKTNNNIHIIEVPVSDFKIIMNDSKKKSAAPKNYCNAGFFANFSENKQPFTLPVGHLVCDYNATSQYTKKYCTERGKFNGKKFTFNSAAWSYGNSFYQKAISTLLIKNDKAEIKEIVSLPTGYNYAISGIPIMKNGSSVNFENDVQTQGWDSSPLYGTWHVFIGLRKGSDIIYVMGMETFTWNMVKTNEAYNKFKSIGMNDVIKLDGGGSFHINVDGKAVVSTWEDRRVNTIICFGENNGSNKTSTSASATTTVNKTVVNNTSNKSNATNNATTATNNKVTTTTATKKSNLSSTIKNVKSTIRNKYRRINGFRFLRAK